MPTIYSSKKDEAEHLSGTGTVYQSKTVCERLIFVEGIDEIYILAELINDLYEKRTINNDIQIISSDGKDNYKKAVNQFAKKSVDGELTISRMLLIRDANGDPDTAFKAMQSVLSINGFTVPDEEGVLTDSEPQTAVFILPSMTEPGMMEDICLATVVDDPAFDCIDSYFKCLDDLVEKGKLEKGPKNLSKAKAAVFLASRPEYKPRIGYADKYWDYSHTAFNRLRDLLREFIG